MNIKKENNIDVSIIIPHFNGKEILVNCLNSLIKNRFKKFEIIIVDNGSSDGSQELIKNEFPQVRLIENAKNEGYAGGCNSGIPHSKGKYILFHNS